MNWSIPKSWTWATLGPHLEEQTVAIGALSANRAARFDRLRGVSNREGIVDPPFDRIRPLKNPSRYLILDVGCFAYNPMRINVGSIGLIRSEEQVGKISPDYIVFKTRRTILPQYLLAYLKSEIGHQIIRTSTAGAVRERLYFRDLAKLHIPLPPVKDQARIVRLLDAADELRRLRAQADEGMVALLPAIYNEMFGPHSTFPKSTLANLVDLVSGGTPTRSRPEFWDGSIPWVSPKDMKPSEICGSEEGLSDAALRETNLKLLGPNCILIVVRGMILAHTIPIRVNRVPVTINQDIKALLPRQWVLPEFMQWALQAQHKHLLSKVSTAGHGTKKLDTDRLLEVSIAVPTLDVQRTFAGRVAEVRALEAKQAESRRRLDDLFASMLNLAFRGEL